MIGLLERRHRVIGLSGNAVDDWSQGRKTICDVKYDSLAINV